MFYFGIDWSEDHHNLCIMNEAGARVSQIKLEHSLAGFGRIELERRKLGVPARECLLAIETSHNLLVDFLLDRGYVVYIIPPQATKSYRNRHRSSGAHTDDSDAALLASILRTDRDSHRIWRPNSPLTQQILAQLRLIESLRRSIQRQSNQLRAVLWRVYPQALGLFDDLTTQIGLQFLIAYPTAQEAQTLSLEEFTAFCREHHYTRSDLIVRRYAHLIEPSATANSAVVQAYRSHVHTLAELLLPQVRCRNEAITQLKKLFERHPDHFIFASLPGAGEILAPALLAKFGDHRDRFPQAADVQALAGTCPVTERSGKKKIVKFRKGCDKEFRRIAQQFAQASVQQSGWAAAYWAEVRPHCDSNSHAYRCLANRWLAIIWKLWQTRQPYDEAYHLRQRALRRRPRS
ncbi:MAG TPA: IS110 family transposase [Anaerolineae bacterium]|nr:IS110 family transposase [Anaerolineae bacterium]